jgi:flagellar biosynthesis protein FlhG
MPDQAEKLRQLAAATRRPTASHSGATTLVVSGGRAGVGATTIALELAHRLAQDANRVVLIDADLYRADLATRCNIAGGAGIGEILAGRKNIHELLRRGAAGMQLLPGTASAELRSVISERSCQRLSRQMQTLLPHVDWLVVDAGNEPGMLPARLWSAADRLLIVTSPEAAAVMDTYALVKILLHEQPRAAQPQLVVNQAEAALAADVYRRIDQSCRRFLGCSIGLAGAVPHGVENDIARVGAIEEILSQISQHAATAADELDPPATVVHRMAA